MIILLPHSAAGSDTAIISGLRINSVTKERSPAPARPQKGHSGGLFSGERGEAQTSSSGLSVRTFRGLRGSFDMCSHLIAIGK
ncbi:putative 24-dienoyl-CoA reductase 3 [Dissostichus eleginoides]|uniref:24-dienoyl-CoA reductase 3 n=1 Tax=Dissostichus eleginoides TaxID=100907 RepID=A0AAD9EWS4_DISEL|nr:putative 24-dienoyl-CoA reductase 3 [Dissostichus eleginoides]